MGQLGNSDFRDHLENYYFINQDENNDFVCQFQKKNSLGSLGTNKDFMGQSENYGLMGQLESDISYSSWRTMIL